MIMSANALKFTTHEGVTKVVPLDTVRLVRPMTDEDKARAKESLKEKKGVDIGSSFELDVFAVARGRPVTDAGGETAERYVLLFDASNKFAPRFHGSDMRLAETGRRARSDRSRD
jgi:hypothetical protein